MSMNYFKLYTTLLLAAVLTSCAKVHGPEEGNCTEGETVSISVSVDSRKFGGSATNSGLPDTRLDAAASSLYSGGTLGLFIDYGKNAKYTQSNVLWENDGTNTWAPQIGMLWGKPYDKVGVYAYAPYLEGQNDLSSLTFTIPTDQSDGISEADLLWWYPGIENGAKKDVTANDFVEGNINITFRHALTKLTVNFELASQFKGQNIFIKEAWFHQSMDKVAINFTGSDNNSVPYVGMASSTSSSPVSIKMHNCSGNGNLSCDVLFFPYTFFNTRYKLLTLTLSDGRDYILTYDKELELVSGTAYEMTVKVGKDKLEAGEVTVSSWIDKGSLGDSFGADAAEYSEWSGQDDIAEAYAGGTGTSDDPYQIATAAQLAFLAQECNKEGSDYKYSDIRKYFKLTADIDLKGHAWTPVGTIAQQFTGLFDGDNHVIINLNVSDVQYAGLFGCVQNGATIKDLVIRNASVSSVSQDPESVKPHNPEAYSGILVAFSSASCKISDCKVDGTVSSDYCAGGIVGYATESSEKDGLIANCTADVNCFVANSTSDSYCGGIAGISYIGKMYNCVVRGKIDGPCDVGGLVGWLADGGGFVYPFSYVYAEVGISKVDLSNLSPSIGGLVGSAYSSNGTKILNCYMLGKVWCAEGLELDTVQSICIGGIVGSAKNVEIGGCHYLGSIFVQKPSSGGLRAGVFIGDLMSGVKANGNNSYMIDLAAGLPVYGYKDEGVDDSSVYVIGLE